MNNIKLLLVEDEAVLATIIKETLEKRGFDISIALNGVDGWFAFKHDKPDVCVIDIMMPRKDGLSLVADIREVDEWVPVILLTAKTQQDDVLKGLDTGADDYIKKPFSMEELIVRIKKLLRRTNNAQATASKEVPVNTTVGSYRLNYTRLELEYDNTLIHLSQREADVLQLLLEHKNALLDKRTALLKIWGDDNVFNSRSMDVYITRLRKYLRHDAKVEILNVRGKGYKLVE
jgi:DNA-binding response OmpR family regulator